MSGARITLGQGDLSLKLRYRLVITVGPSGPKRRLLPYKTSPAAKLHAPKARQNSACIKRFAATPVLRVALPRYSSPPSPSELDRREIYAAAVPPVDHNPL